MRRIILRSLIAATAAALLLSCGGDDLSGADRTWAERVTLEIARVNDVVALRLLPAVLGQESLEPVVTVDGEPTPDWPAVERACSDVEALLPDVRQAATHAPDQLAGAGEKLVAYAEKLEHFVGACHRAVDSEDLETLEVVNSDLVEAGALLVDIGLDLPEDIGCPEDAIDPPQTCDE